MKCPNCSHELAAADYKGIKVDECSNCGGRWFDAQEVDQLEDEFFDADELKTTMITNVRPSERICPKCGKKMKKFNYRWEDLELDFCEKGDGYWLDDGEEQRIIDIIKEDEKNMERTFNAEDAWTNHLKRLQSPSIISKIQDLLGL